MERWKKHLLLLIEATTLLLLFLFALVLDNGFAFTLSWHFYAIMLAFSLFCILPGLFSPQRRQIIWLFLGFHFCLFTLHFLSLSPVKPFTQFQQGLTNGMTVQQVQSSMNRHFPKGGKFRRPTQRFTDGAPVTPDEDEPHLAATPNRAIHYTLDPTDGRYNAEWVIVYLKDGHVVGSEYLGD